jgi:hypothetical protein
MKLFHGSSTVTTDAVLSQGLLNPYLTDDYEIALYYAEVAVDETGGEVIVYEVDIDPEMLEADARAIDEPVLRDEDEVMDAFAKIADDWISHQDSWKVTLELVGSVRVHGTVQVTV